MVYLRFSRSFMCVRVRWRAFVCAFAAAVCSLSAMRKTKPAPSLDLPAAPAREAVRTPLFWLLYDNHARLSETWSSNRVSWPAVCVWAAAHGVADQRPNAVRMTWARVCAVRAQEKADREARQRPAHVRSPASNQTPGVVAPVVNPPNRSQPAPAQGRASGAERVAALNAIINQRSGRS